MADPRERLRTESTKYVTNHLILNPSDQILIHTEYYMVNEVFVFILHVCVFFPEHYVKPCLSVVWYTTFTITKLKFSCINIIWYSRKVNLASIKFGGLALSRYIGEI